MAKNDWVDIKGDIAVLYIEIKKLSERIKRLEDVVSMPKNDL